jgi:SET domain-containing protein
LPKTPPFEVRKSRVHGKGAFATRRIRKGTRIAEYTGPRISNAEADKKYDNNVDGRTYLFIIDSKTVIDATHEGGDARFINHSCDPNCETEMDNKRVYIYATRTIEPGEELAYDYRLQMEGTDPLEWAEHYGCRCGAANCRGTMLWIPRKLRKAAAAMRARGNGAKPATKQKRKPARPASK